MNNVPVVGNRTIYSALAWVAVSIAYEREWLPRDTNLPGLVDGLVTNLDKVVAGAVAVFAALKGKRIESEVTR